MSKSTYNVLIVDDDSDDVFAIRRAFDDGRLDVALTEINGGKDVLAHLSDASNVKPDLILLDINMPRMNGFEVLETLSHNKDWAHIPVIVLSTSSFEADRVKSLELGAVDFATKFASMDELGHWVRKIEIRLEMNDKI